MQLDNNTNENFNNDAQKKMEEDGFLLIKKVLSRGEVKKIRAITKEHLKSNGMMSHAKYDFLAIREQNAAVNIPSLSWLFSHPLILEKLREIISGQIVFTNTCDAQMGHFAWRDGWHKDDGTKGGKSKGYFGQWTYGMNDVQVYKIAIYLQDHKNDSAGLSVIRGSHKSGPKLNNLNNETILHPEIGDIIIFDVRTNHAGQRDLIPLAWNKRNKWARKPLALITKIPKIGVFINIFIRAIYQLLFGRKIAIFCCYGANNSWTKNFAKGNMKRHNEILEMRGRSSKEYLPKETSKALENQKILIYGDN